MKEYDENTAINLMNAAAGSAYSDDELLNIIDMIWDYYEQNGLLDPALDDDNDSDMDIDDDAELARITDYVTRMVKKDRHCHVSPDHIATLVEAEIDYEASLAEED